MDVLIEYFFIVLIVLLPFPFVVVGDVKISRYATITSSLFLMLFTCFRYYSGEDYESYVRIFNESPLMSALSISSLSSVPAEFGYVLLNSIFKTLNIESFLFLAFVALFSVFTKTFFILKTSMLPFCAFIIYFSFVYFNSEFIQIRWALALSIIYIGLFFVLNNKVKTGVLIIAIAVMIHVLSIIPLMIVVVFLVVKNKFKDVSFLKLSVIMIFAGYLINVPLLIIDFIQSVSGENYFIIKLAGYLENSNIKIAWHVILRYIILFSVTSVFYFKVQKTNTISSIKYDCVRNFYLMYSLFFSFAILFVSFPILTNRIFIICDMLSAIIITNGIYSIGSYFSRRTFNCWFILICSSYWLVGSYVFYSNGHISEYKTWLHFVF